MSILKYRYQDKTVLFGVFKDEVYINANISQRFRESLENYLKIKISRKYLKILQNMNYSKENLIIKRDGEIWIHSLLAIDFTRWLNFEFSIWCDIRLKEILSKRDSYVKILEEEIEALQKYIEYQDLKVLFTFEMRDNILKELKKMDKMEERTSFI